MATSLLAGASKRARAEFFRFWDTEDTGSTDFKEQKFRRASSTGATWFRRIFAQPEWRLIRQARKKRPKYGVDGREARR